MKNSKLFLLEKHLTDAIAANPKRDLYLHLRKAKKVVADVTEKLRDGNPEPPTVQKFKRELRESEIEMRTMPEDRQKTYLAALIDRHPDAKADAIAWNEANAAYLAGESVVKFESKDGCTAWKNDVCAIPVAAFDALVDAGVFTEN